MERKVNEVFQITPLGVTLQVCEADEYNSPCNDRYCLSGIICTASELPVGICNAAYREDKTEVYFKLISA